MKIVVCAEITEEGLKSLDHVADYWKEHQVSSAEVHLVHIFETRVYNNEFAVSVYPSPDQYKEVDEAVVRILKEKADDLFKKITKPQKCIYKCLHSTNVKDEMMEYLKAVNPDLVVVPTRGLSGVKGFFSSSFADFLVRHSPCNILVVRPNQHK